MRKFDQVEKVSRTRHKLKKVSDENEREATIVGGEGVGGGEKLTCFSFKSFSRASVKATKVHSQSRVKSVKSGFHFNIQHAFHTGEQI